MHSGVGRNLFLSAKTAEGEANWHFFAHFSYKVTVILHFYDIVPLPADASARTYPGISHDRPLYFIS